MCFWLEEDLKKKKVGRKERKRKGPIRSSDSYSCSTFFNRRSMPGHFQGPLTEKAKELQLGKVDRNIQGAPHWVGCQRGHDGLGNL
jgi:hypothetical protein